MSRAYDFVVAGVVTIIAVAWHRISLALFAPDTVLYSMAVTGTENVNGGELAPLWFEIGSVWVPLIAVAGIWAWVAIKEFRRQVVTARSQVAGPRP